MKKLLIIALYLLASIAPSMAVAETSSDIAARLGRGINILGYDPIWKNPDEAHFKPRYFKMLHDSGFQTVRVNLQAFSHMDAQNRLDEAWLKTLNSVVHQATAAKLNVILDEHDYRVCGQDFELCRTKLFAFWQQIAPRYKDAPSSVLFELMNEPNKAITPALWNSMIPELLSVVRKTNPKRWVVIGPANSNNFRSLDALELPAADRNIIVTIHYYDPFAFTHQGATWTNPSRENMTGVPWGSQADRHKMKDNFAVMARWAEEHRRPIFVGEFGAYEKAAMPDRAAWTAAIARTAEAHHFAWAYWQFESSFSAYDLKSDSWIKPIYTALIPSTNTILH